MHVRFLELGDNEIFFSVMISNSFRLKNSCSEKALELFAEKHWLFSNADV